MFETVFMCHLTDAFIAIFYPSIAHFPVAPPKKEQQQQHVLFLQFTSIAHKQQYQRFVNETHIDHFD